MPSSLALNPQSNGLHTESVSTIKVTDEEKQFVNKLGYLSPKQLADFESTGVLVIRAKDAWTEEELSSLISSVDLMDNWPDTPGKWMKYYEKNINDALASGADITKITTRENNITTNGGSHSSRLLQRIENFCQYNPGLDALLNGDKLVGMCSQLFGQKAVLYKEKINYKLPGGAGFTPHQDISAGWWMYGQSLHISCLITVDEAHARNGCLELAYGEHKRGKLAPDWEEIPQHVVDSLKWESAPTKPGDIVFFDSYVPHRSGPNLTDKPRRVLYATYAKLAEGDFRDKYYADKRISYPPDCERETGKSYEYKV